MSKDQVIFQPEEVRRLQSRIKAISEGTNGLRNGFHGQTNGWSGDLLNGRFQMDGSVQGIQSQLNRLTAEAEQMLETLQKVLAGVEAEQKRELSEHSEMEEQSTQLMGMLQKYSKAAGVATSASVMAVQAVLKNLVTGVAIRSKEDMLNDEWRNDPVVKELLDQAANGSSEEQESAKDKLKKIREAREAIARAQVAYGVYQGFQNNYLMKLAHEEATRQREKLKELGVGEIYYGEDGGADLRSYYTKDALSACSYDPSYLYPEGYQEEPYERPLDDEYSFLLLLSRQEDGKGAWARQWLKEIHEHFSEISRAQQAWREYTDRGMTEFAEDAHKYAEGLRTELKEHYMMNSEVVDNLNYLPYWKGEGPAGEHLKVPERTQNKNFEYWRNQIVDEAMYWCEQGHQVIYHSDANHNRVHILDRNNPPNYMDCSEFAASVYFTVFNKEINIGTNTRENKYRGEDITSLDDLKPGDLIFFDWDDPPTEAGIDHVGIYLGNNKFAQAHGDNNEPRYTDVTVINGYYKKHFVKGCRIILDDNSYVNIRSEGKKDLPRDVLEDSTHSANESRAVSSISYDAYSNVDLTGLGYSVNNVSELKDLSELDILARTIYGECNSGNADYGEESVAWTIINRRKSGLHGDSYKSVVLQRGQYAAVTGSSRDTNLARAPKATDDGWKKAVYLAGLILEGKEQEIPNKIGSGMYFRASSWFFPEPNPSYVRMNAAGNYQLYGDGSWQDIKDIQVFGDNTYFNYCKE